MKSKRIPWNKGLNKEIDIRVKNGGNKSSITKKENFKSKQTIPWNRGLTKETDERIAKYSKKLKGKPSHFKGKILPKRTEEHSKRIVESRRKNGTYIVSDEARLNNSIAQFGKKRSTETKTKQRISALNRILRNNQMLSIGKNEKQLLDEQEIKEL
jgi:hypothetical protein